MFFTFHKYYSLLEVRTSIYTSPMYSLISTQPSKSAVLSSTEVVKSEPCEDSTQYAISLTKPFRTRSGCQTSIAIVSNYGIAIACIAISELSMETSYIAPAWSKLVYLLAVCTIASRLRALENLVHEASHNNLFASPAVHQRLQLLYAFPVFRVVQDYRSSHMTHHKYLGDPERDPDILRLYGFGLDRLPERPYWYLFGLPMTGFLTYEYLTTTFSEFWMSSSARLSKTAYWTIIMLVVTSRGLLLLHQFLYYYLVPLLVILPVTRYWAEMSEHLGLDLRGSFGNSRTNIGLAHTWYMNPHNDGYHAVHHLCSQVPFYHLPKVHKHLMVKSKQFREKTIISYSLKESVQQIIAKKTTVKANSAVSRMGHYVN